MKKFLSLSLVTLLSLSFGNMQNIFATELNDNNCYENDTKNDNDCDENVYNENDTEKGAFKEISKKDVTYTYMFSPYHRVSPTVNGGSAGAQIQTTEEYSYSTTVIGEIGGLGISTGKSYTSSVGITFNVAPHTSAYIGYRVQYLQERGTRVVKNKITGNVTTNNYTVETPMYEQYSLIDAVTGMPITFLTLDKNTNTFLIDENPMD